MADGGSPGDIPIEESGALLVAGDAHLHATEGGKKNKEISLIGCWANLCTATVGVGVLSFPFAFSAAGYVLCTILTIVNGVFNVVALATITRAAEAHRKMLRAHTYEELVQVVLGERWYFVTVAMVLLNQIGSMIGFLIVIGDLGEPVLEHWFAHQPFLSSRAFLLLIFCVFIVFPLSMFDKIHSLAISSVLAVASIAIVVVVVVIKGIGTLASEHGALPPEIVPAVGSGRLFLAVPLAIFALGCQLQVVNVYLELETPSKRKKYPSVLWATTGTAAGLYIIIGFFGYVQFGNATNGNIFVNYALGDVMVDIAKMVMGLHVTLAFPVLLYPARKAIQYLYHRRMQERGGQGLKLEWKWVALQNIILIAVTATVAVVFPQVEVVFGLLGSSSAPIVNFFLPGLLLLRCAICARDAAAAGLTSPSLDVLPVGAGTLVAEIRARDLLGVDVAGDASNSSSDGYLAHFYEVFPPSRAARDALAGRTMVGASAVVMVISMSVQIYTTFIQEKA